MSLGDLGGFFSGDPTANRFAGRVDDVTGSLLAGGQARSARNAAVNQSTRLGTMLAGQASGNPALAARAGAAAGTNAAIDGQMAAAQMHQAAQIQGAGMAQARIERERARVGNALGSLLGMAGSVGAMMIPGGQAGGITGLAQQALPNAPSGASAGPAPTASAQAGPVGGLAQTLGMVDQALATPQAAPPQAPTPPRPAPVPFDRPDAGFDQGQFDNELGRMSQMIQQQTPAAISPVTSRSAQAGPVGPADAQMAELQRLLGLMPPAMQAPTSDEESKHAIRDASQAIDAFLSSMDGGRQFQYNQPNAPGQAPGNQVGVMAQDLERSPMGQQMVQQGPDGQRQINPQTALSGMLAAQARLHQRLSALEGTERNPGSARALPDDRPAMRNPPQGAHVQAVNPQYGMFESGGPRMPNVVAQSPVRSPIPMANAPGVMQDPEGNTTFVGTPEQRVSMGPGGQVSVDERGLRDRVGNDPTVRRLMDPVQRFLGSPAGAVVQPVQALAQWLGHR
jgi:hypothetical protein